MGQTPVAKAGSNILLCYCDADADFCEEFARGLDSLRADQLIAGWQKWRVAPEDSGEFPAGDASQVVLMLLSPEFLATGFPQRKEFLARLSGDNGDRPTVITALVRAVEMTHRTLDDSVAPPLDSRPLSDADDLPSAVQEILAKICDAVITRSAIEGGAGTMDRTIQLPSETPPSRPQPKPAPARPKPENVPERIGRYRIDSVLGQGAFGAVYLAYDEQLARSVAIKTPHRRRLTKPTDVESYMREARMVAQLDHPGIVPVFDVGRTDDGQFFVVSKVIEGKDLSHRLVQGRPSLIESARLVAQVAEALHYAHQRDLVHRDVKPANILIGDADGRPFVADFGLAIREEELGQGPTRAGTPAYMSPEQARGEGHRVDGRSDVFSLGIVLYELITGRLPFRQQNIDELLLQIAKSEARPPRQVDASIPREMERICLKAMSNRIKDRYTTAQDFADDLWFFVNSGSAAMSSGLRSSGAGGNVRESGGAGWEAASAAWTSAGTDATRRSSTGGRDPQRSAARSSSDSGRTGAARQSAAGRSTASGRSGSTVVDQTPDDEAPPAKVVAKGLRAFDNHDADFFLQLVPGPRDRYGLPDVIRFWKSRLDELHSDEAFAVGVMYGPSGCGKTSLVKAGLLPQLAPTVHVVFLDAAAQNTEARLAEKIKNMCPDAPSNAGLAELMAWIRRGRGIPWESKLVVVIDQFEQWLQAHETQGAGELLDALRQCDGVRVQCLLMVRVDFMMSIHRFMNDLEQPIQEGSNSAPVDLFDALHARNVLRLFGASYGRLPDDPEAVDAAGQAFLDAAVAELGPEGKVVPVHLSLFADMCKGRPWRPETLKQLGGVRGVGATFLEETFESTTAPLAHRVHEKACRAVLKSLLPEAGQIRGPARNRKDLAAAAGYAPESAEFAGLLKILDHDTRLITPVERDLAAGAAHGQAGGGSDADADAQYQLTHDYLVPSLREWLTKKQRETARGRAELRLEEFTQLWNDKPAPQRLPGVLDWASIRTLTTAARWTPPQRTMMQAAGLRIGIRAMLAAAAVLGLVWAGIGVNRRLERQRVAGLVDALAAAETQRVPEIIAELGPDRSAAAPLLLADYDGSDASPKERLHAALAALALEAGGDKSDAMLDDVYQSMLTAGPEELDAMLRSLGGRGDELGDRATAEMELAKPQAAGLLPMASLVAALRPKALWNEGAGSAVANQLVTAPSDAVGGWSRQLRPARDHLVGPLLEAFKDIDRPAAQRNVAGDLLVAFVPEDAAQRVARLVDVAEHATSPEQFERAVTQLEPLAASAVKALADRLEELATTAEGLVGAEREALAHRQAHLVVAQLRLGAEEAGWQALRPSAEPTLRSVLIENLHVLGVAPATVVTRVKSESDVGVRRALLLALGGYSKEQLETVDVAELGTTLRDCLANENPGLHAAAQWLIGAWTRAKIMPPLEAPALRARDAALAAEGDAPTWYDAPQGHEMIAFRGPVEFEMGSPANDPDREGGALDETELRHPAKIGRSFAIASKEVTAAQFLAAWGDLKHRPEFVGAGGASVDAFAYAADKAPEGSCPIIDVDWFKAAAYCNWLSQQEGLPEDQWCYGGNPLFQNRLVLPRDYLTRTGYRLPTEAEWEYACRAGTTSGRFFGEAPGLLKQYSWYDGNNQGRTWPVALLKPNDFGLFDVYGNVSEWCQDPPRVYSQEAYDDVEGGALQLVVDAEELRAHRGGAFQYVPQMVTSAARDRSDPDYAYFSIGFRVARTLPAANGTPSAVEEN